MVDYSKLSETDLKIHQRHVAANKAGKLFYVDPQTGYQVMTRRAHLERGECCGNECRHVNHNFFLLLILQMRF